MRVTDNSRGEVHRRIHNLAAGLLDAREAGLLDLSPVDAGRSDDFLRQSAGWLRSAAMSNAAAGITTEVHLHDRGPDLALVEATLLDVFEGEGRVPFTFCGHRRRSGEPIVADVSLRWTGCLDCLAKLGDDRPDRCGICEQRVDELRPVVAPFHGRLVHLRVGSCCLGLLTYREPEVVETFKKGCGGAS